MGKRIDNMRSGLDTIDEALVVLDRAVKGAEKAWADRDEVAGAVAAKAGELGARADRVTGVVAAKADAVTDAVAAKADEVVDLVGAKFQRSPRRWPKVALGLALVGVGVGVAVAIRRSRMAAAAAEEYVIEQPDEQSSAPSIQDLAEDEATDAAELADAADAVDGG